VDVWPVSEVCDVGAYDAVIVGSAVHDQTWLPAAVRFMRDNRAALASRPVWLFSVGMPSPLPRGLRRGAMNGESKAVAGFGDMVGPPRPPAVHRRGPARVPVTGGQAAVQAGGRALRRLPRLAADRRLGPGHRRPPCRAVR